MDWHGVVLATACLFGLLTLTSVSQLAMLVFAQPKHDPLIRDILLNSKAARVHMVYSRLILSLIAFGAAIRSTQFALWYFREIPESLLWLPLYAFNSVAFCLVFTAKVLTLLLFQETHILLPPSSSSSLLTTPFLTSPISAAASASSSFSFGGEGGTDSTFLSPFDADLRRKYLRWGVTLFISLTCCIVFLSSILASIFDDEGTSYNSWWRINGWASLGALVATLLSLPVTGGGIVRALRMKRGKRANNSSGSGGGGGSKQQRKAKTPRTNRSISDGGGGNGEREREREESGFSDDTTDSVFSNNSYNSSTNNSTGRNFEVDGAIAAIATASNPQSSSSSFYQPFERRRQNLLHSLAVAFLISGLSFILGASLLILWISWPRFQEWSLGGDPESNARFQCLHVLIAESGPVAAILACLFVSYSVMRRPLEPVVITDWKLPRMVSESSNGKNSNNKKNNDSDAAAAAAAEETRRGRGGQGEEEISSSGDVEKSKYKDDAEERKFSSVSPSKNIPISAKSSSQAAPSSLTPSSSSSFGRAGGGGGGGGGGSLRQSEERFPLFGPIATNSEFYYNREWLYNAVPEHTALRGAASGGRGGGGGGGGRAFESPKLGKSPNSFG